MAAKAGGGPPLAVVVSLCVLCFLAGHLLQPRAAGGVKGRKLERTVSLFSNCARAKLSRQNARA